MLVNVTTKRFFHVSYTEIVFPFVCNHPVGERQDSSPLVRRKQKKKASQNYETFF